jgi:uncharacterized protein YcnI
VAVGLTALPALAHVTVSSPGATQGSFGVLTFRMPNEMDNANATELKVQLPADQPLASVAVKPEPGWAYTVTRAKLPQPVTDDDGNQVTDYVSVIDWKATAGGVKPGEYEDFDLSVGPLPKADSMTFKAIRQHRGTRAPGADAEAGRGRRTGRRWHDGAGTGAGGRGERRRREQGLGHRRVRRRRHRPRRRAGRAGTGPHRSQAPGYRGGVPGARLHVHRSPLTGAP